MRVRRLGPGDEELLALLAREDRDFDLADRGAPQRPLDQAAAAAYLADAGVLHWVAEDDDGVVAGHLLCYLERRRHGAASQLLVYEVGVREARRRRGVGRALIDAMERWMRENGVAEAWVLADNPGAEAFYRACGFVSDAEQPVSMTLELRGDLKER